MEIKSRIIKNGELCNIDRNRLLMLAKDRGISIPGWADMEQLKLEIAYAEGYMVGKSEKAEKTFKTQERTDYVFSDGADDYLVALTDDQIRLLQWLNTKDFLWEDVTFSKTGTLERIEI